MTKFHPTKITIYGQEQYDLWIASKPDFSRLTEVWFINLPLMVTAPDMPAATYVRFANLPLMVTAPDMPAATEVWFDTHIRRVGKVGAV